MGELLGFDLGLLGEGEGCKPRIFGLKVMNEYKVRVVGGYSRYQV